MAQEGPVVVQRINLTGNYRFLSEAGVLREFALDLAPGQVPSLEQFRADAKVALERHFRLLKDKLAQPYNMCSTAVANFKSSYFVNEYNSVQISSTAENGLTVIGEYGASRQVAQNANQLFGVVEQRMLNQLAQRFQKLIEQGVVGDAQGVVSLGTLPRLN